MDLGHSPDTGASEGELRSGYALTPSPAHSKNISLFTERRTSERAVSKDGYSSFLFNPLWGFPVVAAGILFVVDHLAVLSGLAAERCLGASWSPVRAAVQSPQRWLLAGLLAGFVLIGIEGFRWSVGPVVTLDGREVGEMDPFPESDYEDRRLQVK